LERELGLTSLHSRVLAGDDEAIASMAAIALRGLQRTLSCKFPATDRATLNDAAEDAIIAYVTKPSQYDPTLASLETFLRVIAVRRTVDSLRATRRLQIRHDHAIAELKRAADQPARLETREALSIGRVDEIVRQWPSNERAFFLARLAGERDPSHLSRLLGIPEVNTPCQSKSLKNAVDRLRLRLRRALKDH
jgi:DNA-directed RNA polymerase specialized sigma24 family protein